MGSAVRASSWSRKRMHSSRVSVASQTPVVKPTSCTGWMGGGDGGDGGGLLSQKHAKKALAASCPVWSTSLTRQSPSRPASSYASQMNCADALLSKPLHDVYAHGASGGCSGGGGGGGETGGAGGLGGAGSSGGSGGVAGG